MRSSPSTRSTGRCDVTATALPTLPPYWPPKPGSVFRDADRGRGVVTADGWVYWAYEGPSSIEDLEYDVLNGHVELVLS